MYMRAVIFRIVYLGIVSVGILLGAAFRQSTVQAAPIDAAAPQAKAAPAPRIVTLPTVEVRAAAAHASAAKAPAAPQAVTLQIHDDGNAGSHTAAAPTLRLDMPYYSLGKALPRVGKE
jgi:hypothetical protein